MTAHTLHVHRAGTLGNGPAHGSEAFDRHDARALRWHYRYLRRHGIGRSMARMVVHGLVGVGQSAGYVRGLDRGYEIHRSAA